MHRLIVTLVVRECQYLDILFHEVLAREIEKFLTNRTVQ